MDYIQAVQFIWDLGTREGRTLSLDLMIRYLLITDNDTVTIKWIFKSVLSYNSAIVLHSANKCTAT